MSPSDEIALIASSAAVVSAIAAVINSIQAAQLARSAERRKMKAEVTALAGSILGELDAYFELMEPIQTASNLQILRSQTNQATLWQAVILFPELPKGHPVFDGSASRIGILGSSLSRDISKLYNIVTGVRLLLSHLANLPGRQASVSAIHSVLDQIIRILSIANSLHQSVRTDLGRLADQDLLPWGAGLR